MELELTEILEEADNVEISLNVMDREFGLYLPDEDAIYINPIANVDELGITFLHEMFHHYSNVNNSFISRRLEEYEAERFAQETYKENKDQIINYLKTRHLA